MTGLTRSWWVLPLAVLVAAGTAGANGAGDGTGRSQLVPAVTVAVLAALTLLLHRWPALAIGGNGLIVATYFALGYSDGPIYLTVPLTTLVVANARPPREWWSWSAAAVTLIAVGQGVRAASSDVDWQQTAWQMLGEAALVAASGAVGTALRARREARADRVQRAAAEERLRMAQDLHDGVGHGLAVIAMQAGVALHVLDQEPARARASLEAIRDQSREALDELRSELARMSGQRAPRRALPGVDAIPALVDRVRAGGLAVDLTTDPGELPAAIDHAAYVVVQESLTNVLRHARATRATVALGRRGDRLVVTVVDDGHGTVTAGQDGGMGISGMRSRVEALGGTLEAGGSAEGFRVRATVRIESP
ncbi:sensor histidine kinase [Nocardioides sp. LHG3406-4]|uniref:sensor histidine kinase n=1 Tax=Nocardioides sp. LHG3406-4 TaxID=2804575 RepID=UPI003CF7ACA2